MTPPKNNAGISLVEILVSLAIFSLGIVGLYLSIQSMNKNLNVSMQRDVEGAYANMLISQVDVHERSVETMYDTSGSTKQSITLPDGRIVWYLREVNSQATTADVKEINIYFFRNQSDTTPYRQFKRNIFLESQYFDLRGNTLLCKDLSGRVYTRIDPTDDANLVVSSIRAGKVGANPTSFWQAGNSGDVNGSTDVLDSGESNCPKHVAWRWAHESNPLEYKIPVSQGKSYNVILGFNEFDTTNVTAAGQRVFDVKINGTTVDTALDVYAQAGYYTAFTRSYLASGVADTNGIYTITVRLDKNGGARSPRLNWIGLEAR